jgi:RNA recognition motif-containing protein
MSTKLYVGNLGHEVTDSDLAKMFEPHGTVESAKVIMDRDTGRSMDFGFVEMKTEQQAQAATAALNGQDSGGRSLTVSTTYSSNTATGSGALYSNTTGSFNPQQVAGRSIPTQ